MYIEYTLKYFKTWCNNHIPNLEMIASSRLLVLFHNRSENKKFENQESLCHTTPTADPKMPKNIKI